MGYENSPDLFVFDADGYGWLVPVLAFLDLHGHCIKIDGDIILHRKIPVFFPDELQFPDDIVDFRVHQSHNRSFPYALYAYAFISNMNPCRYGMRNPLYECK